MKHKFTLMFFVGYLDMAPISSDAMQLYLPFDSVIKKADAIFLGRVTEQTSRYGVGNEMIFTDVYFDVTRLIYWSEKAGPITRNNIVLTFAGGSVGDKSVTISDVPSFETGSTYLIFTIMDGKIYASPIVGGFQGLFRVIVDEEQGTQYPLTPGRQGISGIKNGNIVRTPPVHKIRGGAIEGLQVGRDARFYDVAPMPAEGTPGTDKTKLRASVVAVKKGMPAKLMTVDELIEVIQERIKGGGEDK